MGHIIIIINTTSLAISCILLTQLRKQPGAGDPSHRKRALLNLRDAVLTLLPPDMPGAAGQPQQQQGQGHQVQGQQLTGAPGAGQRQWRQQQQGQEQQVNQQPQYQRSRPIMEQIDGVWGKWTVCDGCRRGKSFCGHKTWIPTQTYRVQGGTTAVSSAAGGSDGAASGNVPSVHADAARSSAARSDAASSVGASSASTSSATISAAGGIEAIAAAMAAHTGAADMQGAACRALSSLAYHPSLRERIKTAGGVELVKRAVSASDATELTKKSGEKLLKKLA